MASPEGVLDVGDSVAGRYLVEEVLGRGGMATVYRVRDARSDTRLALKRSSAARDARKSARRNALLEREYYTLSQLAHPSIIEVYEYGIDERGPYYTMELLDGADLDRTGRLPWQQVCGLLANVASSLAILHARGLLHRDVSARNVRCTIDGRAKLIDFGAMTAMGVAKEVVGTPPFMAPEVLQMQELDARADLYSLGALGYFMLTGRHAYPARRLSELRDLWRSRPAQLSRIAPEIPPGLATLIHQLLMFDRNARPQSGSEVMERLCTIAGLPMQERVEVSRAYLARPMLVGRSAQIVELRRRLLALVRGDGSAVFVQGVSGSGRSRLLEAVVLEGKLLGIVVLRADAGDGLRGDFEVARALCRQLIELFPEQAARAARLSRDVLGHVVEDLRIERGSDPPIAPDRSMLLRALREFMLAMCRTHRLLIVIDDADAIDEPSLSLLAALSRKIKREPLLVVLATDREWPPDHPLLAPLALLQGSAGRIEIEPLSASETEMLLESVFGDVANLQLVAGRIHALCAGTPRDAMELLRHLVERGSCRYEAGSWSLPSKLDDSDLPDTLAGSFSRRLAALEANARELADALCLAEDDRLALEDYPALTESGDHLRAFRALDDLIAARVLRAVGERHRFSQQGLVAVLQEEMPEARRAAIHSRIADLLESYGGDVLRRAHHLLHGAREREGVELLCSLDLPARLPPVALLERAIAQAERHQMPARVIQQLRLALLSKASVVLSSESFLRSFPPVLERLEQDSGLALYEDLSELPESERLSQALSRTQQRYLDTDEHERAYPVVEAIRELARVSGAFCSFSIQRLDLEALESLPALTPLLSLSPALPIVNGVVRGHQHWLASRFDSAAQVYQEQLDRIAQPDRGGLDEAQYVRTHLGLHYLMGLFEGSLGIPRAAQRAEALERDREYRVNAWRIRMLLHLRHGNVDEARKCQRRSEQSLLQEGSEQRYLSMGAGFELVAYSALGDLPGIKSSLDSLMLLVDGYPKWQPNVHYGRCRQRWLQGDLEGALDAALAGLALAPATRHNFFTNLAGVHVALLDELGRLEEALAVGRGYVETCAREQILPFDHGLPIAFAKALARAREYDEAVQTIEAATASAEARGAQGFALGELYEMRARIAVWQGDAADYDRYVDACTTEYKKGKNAALQARLARLLEEARQHRIGSLRPAPEAEDPLDTFDTQPAYETIRSRMVECIDGKDRARCALTLLLERTESCAGQLYGVREGHSRLLAALPEVPADERLAAWIDQRLQAELESGETVTCELENECAGSEAPERYVDHDGQAFEAVFLLANDPGSTRIAAVLALPVSPGPRTILDRDLLAEIAQELLEFGDVTGVSVMQEARTQD